jgi:uncharacterized SAM-binding protein YcdF (DUF218 family)
MKNATVRPRRKAHPVLWLLLLAAVAVAVCLGFISAGIVRESGMEELRAADAIVVFGAAEYAGRPSPVLRARLDHALELYQRGLALVIVTTGGSGGDPSYNEGQVGHDYLMQRGVPEASLIAETQGTNTAESATRVGVIMRANHLHSCLAVSDEYHVFRIRKLLEHEGIQVYVAPRADSRPHGELQRTLAVLREATSYLLWRLHIPA